MNEHHNKIHQHLENIERIVNDLEGKDFSRVTPERLGQILLRVVDKVETEVDEIRATLGYML